VCICHEIWQDDYEWKCERVHRWEDSIRMDISEVGQEGVDLLHLSQSRD
jgi:hypothetical protein